MSFTEQTNDKGATIVLEGDIDLEKTEELRDQAMQSLDNNHELEFDMSKVEYIDSSGVSVLIELRQKAEEQSKKIYNKISKRAGFFSAKNGKTF